MEKVEKAYDWITRITATCNNQFHFDGLDKLIELFATNFPEELEKIDELKMKRFEKWNEVHNILY
jgi:hypothetical protein